MKCLLCNEWIEPVAQLSDLIMFKQRREYSCEDCKAQFKKLGKARCSNCYKIIDGNSCFDCKIWAKKGYIPKHFAIYRYEENMKSILVAINLWEIIVLEKYFNKKLKPI